MIFLNFVIHTKHLINMKPIVIPFLAVALSLPTATKVFADEPADTAKFVFTDIKLIPTTSVKDQNKSGTCWCFAGTSFIEDEIVRQGGDSLDLSEMFTVRRCYIDKADRYVRLAGDAKFPAGGVSGSDAMYSLKRYGVIPEEAYKGINYGEEKHVHGELHNGLDAYVNAIVKVPNKRLSTAWKTGMEAILDAYLGEVPETFEYKGKTYTPKSFAESLPINPDDYISVTSLTHHPFYEPFALEVGDNWRWAQWQNVPLDELKAIVDNAVENGFPVIWSADVSEPSFKWKEGYANLPKVKTAADMDGTELSRWVKLSDADKAKAAYKSNGPVEEMEVTQEMRQEMFDRFETRDDHGLEIIGIAKDQNGNRFYKVKNSWDTNHVYDGFMYISEPYLLAKTVGIFLHKDAIPSAIAKKIGL